MKKGIDKIPMITKRGDSVVVLNAITNKVIARYTTTEWGGIHAGRARYSAICKHIEDGGTTDNFKW